MGMWGPCVALAEAEGLGPGIADILYRYTQRFLK